MRGSQEKESPTIPFPLLAMERNQKGGCCVFVRVVRLAVVAALVLGTLLATTAVMVHINTQGEIRRVGKKVHGTFPVLVVTRSHQHYRARIVFYWALQHYLKTLHSYSFTVPPGLSRQLNKELAVAPLEERSTTSRMFGMGSFSVRQLSRSVQLLEVKGTWDDDTVNVGWYEARSTGIHPTYRLRYFGPGQVLRALPASILVTLVLWVITLLVLLRRRHRTERQALLGF